MNDISREGTGEPTADEAVAGLGRMLYDLWRFGSNALVGWQATSWGIEVVTVPKVRFFAAQNPPRRAFLGDRRMGTHTFNDVATAFGVQPVGLRLDRPVGDEDNAIPYSAVERVFSRYAITKTDQRAVFLIDVVGFSKLTPEQQGSQLATIEFALNLAAETAIDHGMAVDMARSTTGDGFYVWNREKGFRADLATGVVMALFLTYLGALKRQIVIPLAVPSIRAAYSI
ncbi:MAG: hypothetical protein FJX47_09920, partial [Alphaproteobacteria bacterium]|nr:hypothetical protein [Alphaproteobacteria bacterium]